MSSARMMKGMEPMIWEALALIVVVVSLLIAILMISGGPLSGIIASFCDNFPGLCGEQGAIEKEQYVTAENSFRALTCAVESVGTGVYMCSEELADPTELNKLVDRGEDTNYNEVGPVVECERSFTCGYREADDCYTSDDMHVTAFGKITAVELCQQKYGDSHTAHEACLKEDETVIEECRLRNIQFPQTVTSAEKRITFYGDPDFLFYYQQFPLLRDTWSYTPDWKTQAAIAAITAFPPTKLIGSIGKSTIVMSKAVKELGVEASTRLILKMSIREGVKDLIKKRFLSVKGVLRVVTKAGVLEGVAQVAGALEKSMSGKYEPVGNALILKSPYDEPIVSELPEEMAGMPIMSSWKPGVVPWRIDSANMVSPCLVHDIKVEKKLMQCEQEYIYRAKTKEVYCGGAHWDRGGNEPFCTLSTYTSSQDPQLTDMKTIMETPIEKQIEKIQSMGLEIWEQEIEVKENVNELENAFGVRWVKLSFPKTDPQEYVGMKIRIKINGKYIYFDDSDDDDYFDSYALENCVVETVNLLFDEWSRNHPQTENDYNYCMDTRSWIDSAKKSGGAAVSFIGGIASMFVPGPGWIAATLLVGSAVGGASLEVLGTYGEYQQYWPGRKY